MSSNQEQQAKNITFNVLKPSGEFQHKNITYGVLGQLAIQQPKIVSYNVADQASLFFIKNITYNVLKQSALYLHKVVTYLVLAPLSPFAVGPIPIFPTLPQGFPVKVSLVMDTVVGTTKSLREMRVAQQTYPLWDIEILFEELRDQTQNQQPYGPLAGFTEYEQLCQLFLMMYGQGQVFAFDCPWDDSRANQPIGTGDGVTKTFQVYRTWGIGATATFAPVGMLNFVTSVEVDSVNVPDTQYSLARDTISFDTAPANGASITMTFSFYYLCQFVADEQDFDEFSKNRWQVPSLKFQAVIWFP